MSGVIVGRLRMVVAMKSDSKKPMSERAIPKTISKINPDMKMFRIWWILFSVLFWAVKRIMAKFTPQSRNSMIIVGAVMAMAYKP